MSHVFSLFVHVFLCAELWLRISSNLFSSSLTVSSTISNLLFNLSIGFLISTLSLSVPSLFVHFLFAWFSQCHLYFSKQAIFFKYSGSDRSNILSDDGLILSFVVFTHSELIVPCVYCNVVQ